MGVAKRSPRESLSRMKNAEWNRCVTEALANSLTKGFVESRESLDL